MLRNASNPVSVSPGADQWRRKKRHTGTVVPPQRRRVPSYLNTQIRDPAFMKISKISEECLHGICADNVSDRVVLYHDAMMAFFRHNGVGLLQRMLATKKLCEIILQEHSRLRGFVTRASRDLDCMEDLMDSLDMVSDCYPTSSKHRNAPSATRKMQELEDEQKEMDRQDRRERKRKIEESGGSIVEWTDDENED